MSIANFHPLLVHLPIGILFIGFLLEVWGWKKPGQVSRELMLFILGNVVVFSLLSILTGWLLGNTGGYDENALDWHRWMGISFTVITALLLYMRYTVKAWTKKAYLPVFAIALVLLTLTGHYGGNLTHGEGFLFTDHNSEPEIIEDIDQAMVHAQVVQPILDAKCVSCHNASKIKGGLRMDTAEELLKGGDSGSALDSLPEWEGSLLVHRIELEMEDEEHMPPKGKVQLTPEEIRLLQWWMDSDHCMDCKVADLEVPANLEPILNALETDNSFRGKLAREVEFVAPETLEDLNSSGFSVQQLSEDIPLIAVNFLRRKNLREADFEMLEPIAEQVVELELSSTNFSDTLAPLLKEFPNVTRLQLRHTPVTSQTLAALKPLKNLESLSLFGAALDSLGAEDLPDLPALAELYLAPEQLNSQAASALDSRGIRVFGLEIGEVFRASKLGPPVIIAQGDIFKDSLEVALESGFEEAETFYAIPQANGDTLVRQYNEPFYLKQSAELLAYSEMEGWGRSPSSRANFLRKGHELKEISLARTPHPKYTAQGGNTLANDKRGTDNFVDGQWIGYEKINLMATLELEQESEVHSVAIGHLSAPVSWIFSPVGYRLWGASEGGSYRLLTTLELPPNKPENEVIRKLVTLKVDGAPLKRLRLEVINQGVNPDWHPNPGGGSFIFIDEVVVD